MHVRIFLMSLMSVCCQEVSGGWTGEIDASRNAFGCWEQNAKGLG
jgi:hypothetical protein